MSAPLLLARRLSTWLLAVLALLLPGCAGSAVPESAGSGPGFTKVTIPLLMPGRPDPTDTAVTGYLLQQAGGGRFPAIILMHGCDGLEWERRQAGWLVLKRSAERYVAHGYVAMVLDSFAPRGVDNICSHPQIVSPRRRAWDAYSAAHYLASLGDVDPKRLVLEGDSHGGWTTLVALESGAWQAPEQFAAGIAWYPYCPDAAGFSAPVLILIGEADDWTSAARCQAVVARMRARGATIDLHIFPGATHAYDFPYPPRINPQGHYMTYDAAATQQSWQAIDAFLARTVSAPP